ncbi:nascent polypeptide-associated complex subunit alpha muscle-specific form [Drosophila madeirensis]|uniref:Nascent polypeptide-associated complex subunit alpha muscle-specific form n=1 Tax=Drosophila madeirensis TaxID=30013 RepID=A0AAU9FFF7_DROMD
MSERSKGDVSSRGVNNNPNATRVVKNSLLSASVTGLSYEDFPNKPQLLPAAPPVVHAPPPAPTPALIAGILNRGKCVTATQQRCDVGYRSRSGPLTCCFPLLIRPASIRC